MRIIQQWQGALGLGSANALFNKKLQLPRSLPESEYCVCMHLCINIKYSYIYIYIYILMYTFTHDFSRFYLEVLEKAVSLGAIHIYIYIYI